MSSVCSNYSGAVGVKKCDTLLEKQVLDLFIKKLKKVYFCSAGTVRHANEKLNPATDKQFFCGLFLEFIKSIFTNPVFDKTVNLYGPYELTRINVTDIFYKNMCFNVMKSVKANFKESQIVHLKNIPIYLEYGEETPVLFYENEYLKGVPIVNNHNYYPNIKCIECNQNRKVIYVPCGHHLMCKDCSRDKLKCVQCQENIILTLSV
jgi:hypothetical protein